MQLSRLLGGPLGDFTQLLPAVSASLKLLSLSLLMNKRSRGGSRGNGCTSEGKNSSCEWLPRSPWGAGSSLRNTCWPSLAYYSQLCTVLKWQFNVVPDLLFKYLQCYNKWYSSKWCYHFAFTNHALQIISTQDRKAKSLLRFNWNDATSRAFSEFPRCDYSVLYASTYIPVTDQRSTQDIMFLFITHKNFTLPICLHACFSSKP